MTLNVRAASLACLFVAAASAGNAVASPRQRVAMGERARGARQVVVASVADVQPRFDRNQFGDQLIISRVRLRVDENLKGTSTREVVVDVEGGTIGDLTLSVSDLPALRAGERGVFFLEPGSGGILRPHRRGLGILKLAAGDRIVDEDLRLSDLRAQVLAAGQ